MSSSTKGVRAAMATDHSEGSLNNAHPHSSGANGGSGGAGSGVLSLREDAALSSLKQQLGIPDALSSGAGARAERSGGTPCANPPMDVIDCMLMRYLRQCGLSAARVVEKLRQRREFEQTLPQVTVTPYVVHALRSGAFAVIGEDILHRPVLHVRMRLFRPPNDDADTDRLVLLLLEYMNTLTMRHFSSSSRGGVAVTRAASSTAAAQDQECAVLVTDGENNGVFASRRAMLVGKITSLAAKYYPGLVGCVLLVDLNWALQQGLRATTSAGSAHNATSARVLHVVRSEHLPRYIDPHVLPDDVGGRKVRQVGQRQRHQSCVEASEPTDWAQIVLRHWFNTTGQIAAEDLSSGGGGGAGLGAAGGGVVSVVMSRPLWQPLPLPLPGAVLVGGGSGGAFMGGDNAGGASAPVSRRHRAHSNFSQSCPSERSSVRGGGGAFGDDDDGVCSVITGYEDPMENSSFESGAAGASPPAAAASSSHAANSAAASGAVLEELRAERRRREQLEQEVSKLTLGIALDESSLTRLEVSLREHHRALNVLVAEVIQTAKGRGRLLGGDGGGASIAALLEATDRALLQATQCREEVPAMRFAQPVQRREASGCCALM